MTENSVQIAWLALVALASIAGCSADIAPSSPDTGLPLNDGTDSGDPCTSTVLCWDAPIADVGNLVSVWASSPDDVWMAGPHTLVHLDGDTWTTIEPPTPEDLHSLWGTGPDDIWAVAGSANSSGAVLHYDGASWSTVDIGPQVAPVVDIHGFTTDAGVQQLWAVGNGGLIHAEDGVWTTTSIPQTSFHGVHADGSGQAFAGGHSAAFKWGGENWEQDEAWTANVLGGYYVVKSVWSSGLDTWAVGTGVARRTNGTWEREAIPVTTRLERVWGSAADDIWAVGGAGLVLHYDGNEWTTVEVGAESQLLGVYGAGASDVWIVGYEGVFHGHL